MFLYTLSKIIIGLIFNLFYPLRVKGLENFPKKGGVILVANHCSYFDPLYIVLAIPRKINWMMLKSYYDLSGLRWFFKSINNFPVNSKGPNIKAIKHAICILKQGKVLGIFPEGSRSKDGKLQKGELGTALLALKSSVPILPVVIQGAFDVFPPHARLPRLYRRVKVQIDHPLHLTKINKEPINKETLQLATEQIMKRLKKLIGEDTPSPTSGGSTPIKGEG